jgi:hypothetical protein
VNANNVETRRNIGTKLETFPTTMMSASHFNRVMDGRTAGKTSENGKTKIKFSILFSPINDVSGHLHLPGT